jgi:hypothetical protein
MIYNPIAIHDLRQLTTERRLVGQGTAQTFLNVKLNKEKLATKPVNGHKP